MNSLKNKTTRLKEYIKKLKSVVVAFSGGVDSAVLAKVCADVLADKALAITAISSSQTSQEEKTAKQLALSIGISHIFIRTDEFSDHRFLANNRDRCYWCKRELFKKLFDLAKKRKAAAVLDGTNLSDMVDDRPGFKANREFGVVSPLLECGLNKTDIRQLARNLRLAVHDKPQTACLASRMPFGTPINKHTLEKINRAEVFLKDFFPENIIIRARDHGDTVRVEIENNLWTNLSKSRIMKITKGLKGLGYRYVTLDMEGYIPAGLR